LDELINYGVLARTEEGAIVAFAGGFHEYLLEHARDVPIWPLWNQTEAGLRRALDAQLRATYREPWEIEYRKKYLHKANIIKEMSDRRRKYKDSEHVSLLNFSYPMDLFELMQANWKELGEPILGRDKSYWKPKFEIMAKVRNPLAHNNQSVVKESEVNQAKGICQEIIELISCV